MKVEKIAKAVLGGAKVEPEDAASIVECGLYELLYWSNRIREHYKGGKIKLCGIINAKSGLCTQDCRFCAQSARYNTGAKEYPLVSRDKMREGMLKVKSSKAHCCGIVTSGHGLDESGIDELCASVSESRDTGIKLSASPGSLNKDSLLRLKNSGINKFHHNLETARSYFKNICTTHSYEERVNTVKNAKHAGLEVCCGGIFGLGETFSHRIELAFTLRELNVDSVPVNFLNPVKGTPMQGMPLLSAGEALRIIAVFRFILPDRDISVCGGREVTLRDLQSWIFYAGANGMMTGGYLTTCGRKVEEDLNMIHDLGYEIHE